MRLKTESEKYSSKRNSAPAKYGKNEMQNLDTISRTLATARQGLSSFNVKCEYKVNKASR